MKPRYPSLPLKRTALGLALVAALSVPIFALAHPDPGNPGHTDPGDTSADVLKTSPDTWIALGKRIHGGFGSYVALGIRIGIDATQKLGANPRELDVTYASGKGAPCPCVADGLMLATYATPGQGTLRVTDTGAPDDVFGIATIRHKVSGRVLRYTIPLSAAKMLNEANKTPEGVRFDTIMGAEEVTVYNVEDIEPPTPAKATKTAWRAGDASDVSKTALTRRVAPVASCCTAS